MTDRTKKTALVAGATGVVGRSLLHHLTALEDWDIVALSRRPPDIPELKGQFQHIAVDLLDPDDCHQKLSRLTQVTHIFFSAYIERASWAEMVQPNLAMLVNLIDTVEPVAPHLSHINLMHGTKWYGNHLGPFKTPAKESDPGHMPPNFYYDQQHFISQRQQGKSWNWSSARPHGICGFALGNPMNLVMVIAVYITLSKALGLPLRHPGSRANAHALYQVTDARLLARACTWMATTERCANESFNITNGDIFRWENMWPVFADYFSMEIAQPQGIDLVAMMGDKEALWNRLTEEHDLQRIPYQQLVNWNYGNFVFTPEFDIISSTTKSHQYGFNEVLDSEEMFLRHFDELRANKVIP